MPEGSRGAPWPTAFWAVLVLATVVRLGYVLFYPQLPLCPDCQRYDEVGLNVAEGRGFIGGFSGDTLFWPQVHNPTTPEIGNGPVYPTFLAAIYWLFGHEVVWVRIAQAAIAALSLVPLFALLDSSIGRAGALRASTLVAVYPAFIVYSGFVLTETLSTTLLVVTTCTLHRAWVHGRAAWWMLTGTLMGVSTLIRAEFLFVFVAMGLLTIWRRPARSTVTALALVAVAAAVTMAPWTIRNYRIFHRVIPVSVHDGDTLWISVKGWTDWHFGDPELQALVRGLDYVEESDALRQAAIRDIADHPFRFAATRLTRFPDFWLTGHTSNVVGVSDSFATYWQRGAIGVVAIKGALLTFNVGLIGLGLMGIARALASRTLARPDVLLLATPIVSLAAVHLVLFAAPRYQVPMMPFVLAFAGRMAAGAQESRAR
jgi:4-amino-4-deoxy-L-arabinose transferase-like glycosyltransferase